MPAKAEVAKDALPKEPEQGLKWRRDVAEVELQGTPVSVIDSEGEEFKIPAGYGVSVERWTLESDHELTLGKTYALISKRFGKETLSYVSPLAIVARRGTAILYKVQKIKPISSAPAKSTKEMEIDERFNRLEALLEKAAGSPDVEAE